MSPEEYVQMAERVVQRKGWKLNPDEELVLELVKGLLENRRRYGKSYCPCRVVVGNEEIDRKIICPCVYAGQDISWHGRCFCGLYVSQEVYSGAEEMPAVIPDRHAEELLKFLADK
ncbi:ferredoxin-thioredoxin reductase catalytic domain-containing protein [Geoglobus acetivorans]|uniref:ferredoxin:thioredoxin reductase n=1 Tax=Geoglobus acetivorans TaxID=565033 RepID=A0ABZ3H1K1_GEOAI